MSAGGRYAVYFAPAPGSPLARFGAEWLGYDADTGEAVARERQRAATADPARYGFHATLKAPFALAENCRADALDEAVARLAGCFPAFSAPPLRLARVDRFWALVPSLPCPMLDRVATACVSELDRFRAPLSSPDLHRRRSAGLSAVQDALLLRWGYPYVMQEFRFHMTLTGPLGFDQSEAIGRDLATRVAPFCETELAIDALSVFHQPETDAAFRRLRRHPLSVQ